MKSARLPIWLALLPVACVQEPATTPPPPPVAARATATETPSTLATTSPTIVEQPSKISASPAIPSTGAAPGSPDHTAPSATTSARVPRERIRLDVPAGALLPVEVRKALSSASSKTGDDVLAVLAGDVTLNGFKLDKGAEVRGQVKTAVPGMGVKGRAQLVLVFDAVMENGEKLSLVIEAIDGRVAATTDKNKGAVIVNKDDEIEIPRGARLTLAVVK